jgi:hypothetical protein
MSGKGKGKLSRKYQKETSTPASDEDHYQDGDDSTSNSSGPAATQDLLANQVKSMLTSDTNLLNTLANTIASILINSTDLIMKITDKLKEDVTQHVYEAMSFDINQQSETTTTLTKVTDELSVKIASLEDKLEDYEQYSRRNCLLIHGIPETKKENTNSIAISTITDRLEIPLTDNDIDRSHRLGRKQTANPSDGVPHPRPIIIKFCRYGKREKVFKVKSRLKKTGIVITENLTARRMALLKAANNHESVSSAWTTDGRVQCITTSETFMNIKSIKDLDEL